MIDLSKAKRSEVQKLEFGYNDYELFYRCLSNVLLFKKDRLAGPLRELLERNCNDLDILLKTMREEGTID